MKRVSVIVVSLGVVLGPVRADSVREEQVEFDGGSPGVRLAGTLLIPDGAALVVPGVLLVTGSGAQDRDETLMGRKPFKVLAAALAARGYAVLRYDDRGTQGLGIGASTGSFAGATLADFAGDAAAGLAYLGSRPEVDGARVAICGHSTGGLEAAMLLGQGRVPGAAVLLAAPAVQGATLLAHQTAEMLAVTHRLGGSGMTDEQVAKISAVQTELIHAYVSGDEARLNSAARAAVAESVALRSPGGPELPEETLAAGSAQALAPMREVWMDHFLRYDPAEDLAAAKAPVLAVFGGRDLQVSPAINVGPATEALARAGDERSMVVVLPVANHMFQTAAAGLPAEYGKLTDEMGPSLSEVVCDWLDGVFGAGASLEGRGARP